MKTKSNKLQNLFLLLMLVAVVVVFAVFFSACSRDEVLKTYGYEKAVVSSWIAKDNQMHFYLDETVTGNYLRASKYAIAKANAATNTLTVTANGDKNSRYGVTVDRETTEGAAAYVDFVAWIGNHYYDRVIVFNDRNVSFAHKWFPWLLNGLAVHEIGHALGLRHVDHTSQGADTIMTTGAWTSGWIYTDFTWFDKANLQWLYDQGGREQMLGR